VSVDAPKAKFIVAVKNIFYCLSK